MNKPNLWKTLSATLLAFLVVLVFMSSIALGDSEIKLKSSDGGAGPDIEMSPNGVYLAVAYYKQDSTAGAVYLKSASTNPNGWVSSTFLGKGSDPQVAFKRDVDNVVYVVWVNSNRTAIQSARCTLNPTTQPTCVVGNNVRVSGAGDLAAPDIVVDGSNYLHVAWQKGLVNSEIETLRSNSPDSVTTWPSSLPPKPGCGGGKAEGPALGWTSASNQVHLAFLCGSSSFPATSIEYNRSADSSHGWIPRESFNIIDDSINDEISNTHSKLGNLAMAAGGSQVSLVWDGLRTSPNFGLMSLTSTNSGDNWLLSGTGGALYVPSGADAFGPGSSEDKYSTISTVPPQEYGLRPSLVITGTTGDAAAVVWQQKLNGGNCAGGEENGSSEIHFVNSHVINETPSTLGHTDPTHYSIDPDLAVGADKKKHFVFMKDINASNCTGGLASAYAIYYQGPFDVQTNDQGEIGNGDIYLPLILK